MPIYEYHCEACGHEFELLQKITDKPIQRCEACHKPRARRLISQSSFQLKGGGWYSDLYSSSGSKPASTPASSSPAPAKSESTPSSKKD